MKGMKKIGLLLLTAVLLLAFNVQPVNASIIWIDRLGVHPNTAPIRRDVNVYTFTDSIYCDGIWVLIGDITIDGDGYTLHGPNDFDGFYDGFHIIGTDANDVNNVTIQNVLIENFRSGIHLGYNTHDNIIRENTIANCRTAIKLGPFSRDNKFYHNNSIDNCEHVRWDVSDGNEMIPRLPNTWDNNYPSGGNYWRNYEDYDVNSGPDQNQPKSDGIWDTNYPIDVNNPIEANNVDRFPLKYAYMLSVHNRDKDLDYYTIQEAVNDANRGDIIRVSGGVYYQKRYYEQPYYENVDVNKSVWLIGDGPGTTVIDGVRDWSMGVHDNVVEITTNHTSVEGFRIQNAGNGKYGVDLSGPHQYNHIVGNTITDNPYGVKLDNGSNYNSIVKNRIEHNDNRAIDINDSNGILVSGNIVKSNGGSGIAIKDTSNTKIVDNTLELNCYTGIYITGDCKDNDVRGNKVSDCDMDGHGVELWNCGDANTTIVSNALTNTHFGIYLVGTSGSTISDNEVVSSNWRSLYLLNSPDNIIKDNVVKSSHSHGIHISSSSGCEIIGNKVLESNADGIVIADSPDCNIIANILRDNDTGILLDTSDANVMQNIVVFNNWGIDVWEGGNLIYHNLFINHVSGGTNAEAGDAFNCWDNNDCGTYHRSGNFWDTYLGEDEDGDYIGDTNLPVVINAPNNVDYGPLILVSYEFSTDPVRPIMKRRYIADVNLTNNTAAFFPPGFDVNFAGLEQTYAYPGSWLDWHPDAGWRHPTWLTDLGKQDSLFDPPYVIHPNESADFARPFTNEWNWIKPNDWKGVIWSLLCTYPGMPISCSVVSFIEACYNASKAVPCMTYRVDPNNDASDYPVIRFKRNVTVYVPLEKLLALGSSLGLQVLSIHYAIIAAPLLSNPFTFAAGVGYAIASAVCTVGSIGAYYVAEDPDPNYTEVFQPWPIDVPNDVNLPPGSVEERLVSAALDLLPLERAYERSYVRYDYARTADYNAVTDCNDPNEYYMGLQLAAALKYNDMAARKLQELQLLTAVLTAEQNIPELDDVNVAEFRDVIDQNWNNLDVNWDDCNDPNALIQIQKDILEVFDFNDPFDANDPNDPNRPCNLKVKTVMLNATKIDDSNTLALRTLCYDPNNLYRYGYTMMEAHYIADYALWAAAEAENLIDRIKDHYVNDIAIIDVRPSLGEVYLGGRVAIDVEVENYGTATATFDVNVHVGDVNTLGPKTVDNLAPAAKATLTFTWDTKDVNGLPVLPGTYEIKAEAEILVGEKFIFDNNCIGGIISVEPIPALPEVPTLLQCTRASHNTVSLAWVVASDVNGYRVYRDGYCVGWSQEMYCTDTGLTPCTTYTYTVSAYNDPNESSQSNAVEATTHKNADLNGDCRVDCNDLDIMTEHWLQDVTAYERPEDVGDIYCDCGETNKFVDFLDYAVLADRWWKGCDEPNDCLP